MSRQANLSDGTTRLRLVDVGERGNGLDEPEPIRSPQLELLALAQALSQADSVTELELHLGAFFASHLDARGTLIIPNSLGAAIEPGRLTAFSDEHLSRAALSRVPRLGEFWVALPMEYRNARLGTLLIAFDATTEPSEQARELTNLAAFVAAGELARLTEYRRVEDHIADLRAIRALERQIGSTRDLRAMADLVRDQINDTVACTMCAVLVVDDAGEHLEVVAHRVEGQPARVGFRVPVRNSRVGDVIRSGTPLVVGNIQEDSGAYSRESANWKSLMIVPLMSGERIFGALMVGHIEADQYDERDLRIVELVASQAANAIYRFLEEQREHEQHLAAIEALSAAVDARDPFTHTHSRRVADLAYIVAHELNLSEREAREIELAGLLHDIGKIGIPDRILTKPGRLDTEERLIMMSHADMGARIVGRSSALDHLTPIVRHHHEWYDGRGYPDGLRGDEIPLGASILAVVDALETMTSHRVYRRALPLEEARREIERGRGSQFHPEIVDVVLRLLDSNARVNEILADAPTEAPGSARLAPIRSSDVVALRVLNRIGDEIGALTNLDHFLNHVHGILREELDIEDVIIWLHDDETGDLKLAAGDSGLPPPTGLAPLQRREADSGGLSSMFRREDDEAGPPSIICAMNVEDSRVGLIELLLHGGGTVEDHDVDLFQAIAAPVASTVRVAQLHDQAKRAARTDGLTGVLNHRAFYHELDRRISALKPGDEVHLLIIDVVGLKATNDNYGHIAGDNVLRSVAGELVRRLRAEDIVSRYGGDEFAVILQGPLDLPVEAIIERLEQPVPVHLDGGMTLTIRLRCGHAVTGAGEGRATELVARADALLYERVRPTERGVA